MLLPTSREDKGCSAQLVLQSQQGQRSLPVATNPALGRSNAAPTQNLHRTPSE